jgi:hypothetical protein
VLSGKTCQASKLSRERSVTLVPKHAAYGGVDQSERELHFPTLPIWPMRANGAELSQHELRRKVIDLQWVAEAC